jgi:hypothetical protein
MTRRAWWTVAAVLAVAVHLVALYFPRAPDPIPGLVGIDKAAHVALFAVPVWLVGMLTARVWLVAALFAAHAVVSEFVQFWFLPQRSGDPLDLVANLAGIALAMAFLLTRRGRAGLPAARRRRPDAPSP